MSKYVSRMQFADNGTSAYQWILLNRSEELRILDTSTNTEVPNFGATSCPPTTISLTLANKEEYSSLTQLFRADWWSPVWPLSWCSQIPIELGRSCHSSQNYFQLRFLHDFSVEEWAMVPQDRQFPSWLSCFKEKFPLKAYFFSGGGEVGIWPKEK